MGGGLKGKEIYKMGFRGEGLSFILCRRVASRAGREDKNKDKQGKGMNTCVSYKVKVAGRRGERLKEEELA